MQVEQFVPGVIGILQVGEDLRHEDFEKALEIIGKNIKNIKKIIQFRLYLRDPGDSRKMVSTLKVSRQVDGSFVVERL